MVNQIEEIEKLYAKTKIYKIPKKPKEGEKQSNIEVTPLSFEDMSLLNMEEEMSLPELSKQIKLIFSKSLKIKEDEAVKISFKFMEELFEAIADANDFKEEDIKKIGIKEFMAQKKKQIKEKEGKENAKSDRKA